MVKVVRGKNFQSSALFRCLPVTSAEICPSRFKNKVQYSKATPHQKKKTKTKTKQKTASISNLAILVIPSP